jgi:hypothetical protein
MVCLASWESARPRATEDVPVRGGPSPGRREEATHDRPGGARARVSDAASGSS